MRCDECRFWNRESGTDFVETGECTKAKPLWDCTEWRDVGDDYKRVMLPECRDMKMFVQDGSDYKAILLTKADFFCAEYEASK